MNTLFWLTSLSLALSGLLFACGDDDDDGGSEADRRGVAAECATDEDCTEEEQRCLTDFKGGYCGLMGCETREDCPAASACVAHSDGETYCFRTCRDKIECNANRSAENEANCSANITFTEQDITEKACVPPSG